MDSDIVAALIFIAICLAIYFAPSLVAWRRHHLNANAIFLLNLFLGWTFLGWIAALVWAVKNEPGSNRVAHGSA